MTGIIPRHFIVLMRSLLDSLSSGSDVNMNKSFITSRMFIFVFAFIFNMLLNVVKWAETKRINWSEKFYKLPTSKWNNDYPIVLVYGMGGTVEDQAPIFT